LCHGAGESATALSPLRRARGIVRRPRAKEKKVSAQTGLVETYRGGVSPWECDVMNHFNIAFYVGRLADAASDLMERYAPERSWRTLVVHTSYEQELRAGDGIAIRSGIIAVGGDTLRLGHEATNSATGARTTIAEHVLSPAEPEGWSELRDTLAAASVAWQAPAFGPIELPAGPGPIPSGRDRVKPWEANTAGQLSLTGILHRCSAACLHVLDAIGMTDAYRRRTQRGFSTFESRLAVESPANVGEGVVVESAVLHAGTSSLRMLHRLHESRSRRPLAHFYQAGAHFDIELRRSAPLPPEIKEKLLALQSAGSG